MTAAQLFAVVNFVALLSWIVLALGVAVPQWRGAVMPPVRLVPIALGAFYSILILLFFAKAPGGFDSLANVKLLFTSDWAALAGWVHYLAFDLFMGLWIAGEGLAMGLPRWLVLALLPPTFLFGPVGLIAFAALRFLLSPKGTP